jgi:antitoxin component of RelBE/YafQ-DinJ toxin-antitoxin module
MTLAKGDYDKMKATRARIGRVQFNIRGLDSDVRDAFRAWCHEHGYSMQRAIERLMRDAARDRRRCAIKRRGYNTAAVFNARGIHPDVMKRFKAYCALLGYTMRDAIEWLMLDAVRANRELKITHLHSTF